MSPGGGRIDQPPAPSARANFPLELGRRAIVMVDTEEEFDWTKPRSRDETGTSAIKYLPEFQSLMEANGHAPCYLIDFPVAANPQSADVMAGLAAGGRCNVGTQLHPWVNPPFDEKVNTYNSFVGNLPIELERAKLAQLTATIEKAVGQRPVVYRAGRYGIGPNSAELLEAAGYRIDSSVRPWFDYSPEGGPDFRGHDTQPFWAGPRGTLLELPLSVAFNGVLRRWGNRLIGGGASSIRRRAWLSRLGLASRVALTPEDMPFEDVRAAIRAMLGDGEQLLSISFHSPSLAPGHTPYVRNSAQLSEFYRWWDRILKLLEQEGVKPISITGILDAAWSQRQ